ncbi:MAG: ComEA family DNA-binding protein [Candidatus Brocadiaceae bacterium]|nr:ComEA family DNA-binding protein [Candidatus Brocadiaceae bacterium]
MNGTILRNLFVAFLFTVTIVFVSQTEGRLSAGEIYGKVNINTATETELRLLPEIGPKLAGRVVDYRAENGNFETIDDLKRVNGVGDKKFEKMKNYLIVTGETTIETVKPKKEEKGKN